MIGRRKALPAVRDTGAEEIVLTRKVAIDGQTFDARLLGIALIVVCAGPTVMWSPIAASTMRWVVAAVVSARFVCLYLRFIEH